MLIYLFDICIQMGYVLCLEIDGCAVMGDQVVSRVQVRRLDVVVVVDDLPICVSVSKVFL